MSSPRADRLSKVRQAVRAVEDRGAAGAAAAPSQAGRVVKTGWPAVDAVLPGGGLRQGAVHEWLGEAGLPLGVMTHLAWRSITMAKAESRAAVWVGRGVWPEGHALVRGADRRLLERSVFIEAEHIGQRLWAADLAARSAAVGVVIADGRGFDMAATRRLQLAARAVGVLMLLGRDVRERGELSAAATRWQVQPTPSPTHRPRWAVQRLRCKGVQGGIGTEEGEKTWHVEYDRAEGVVGVSAGLADRATHATAGRSRSRGPGKRRRSA